MVVFNYKTNKNIAIDKENIANCLKKCYLYIR